MQINGQKYHVTTFFSEEKRKVLLMLHGFTGTNETYKHIISNLKAAYDIVAPDLLGHGKTVSPKPLERYSMEQICQDLAEILRQLEVQQCILLGYSMGGRVATSFAAKYPEKVQGLILVNSSPGIEQASDRESRMLADNRLADSIEQEGIQAFVKYWEELPLFASQQKLPVEIQTEIRDERLSQKPFGLAMSLRGMGTGKQDAYWVDLANFTFPVLLITAEFDKKFQSIADEMLKYLPNATQITIKQAGHAVYLEQPSTFLSELNHWLEVNLKEEEQ
ncbi:2-succinyl-6-hydroxy-2,4-cyclohexadiene-1-carboxylate synthase [Listeria ivanovii]|uniref:Putative 2-succinyl-6-hydroxy-2,4-cyclohexadiene-1-carboxylate synthase n=1 Tax=Listeria ivanovii (strain ATCC BAA-678 / PAM 55) TaxID=881621 RepID=G2ZAT3_LISIP|nr:2-succinyl-6-hydroxy-2,4-cyclohexadiene-1-carboxylate synthase [Listeria ivanovii]AHI56187.1 esterase [Listeria ivanovii WSLC3009]AIS65618.1 esterase [Listeria ivanovii subsp. ivanovii]MBC1759541.1 2-succinyl-6-hydroxy-2,4-cyclohexadiene-1-carboxylate synthase [Listeria ivanovii]MBK3915570.1 2-succinyl-6-hydroxy-2,4-cyclohexadiene-1-carboxylate synthase [Listeria ivanovii subsp. ivanovii]MBK3922753.1 2-succinyl-6-hydroxy-2,4-cyclohexadiene-1-carboxylate synthase [Listeria ivanovii subsp. iv